MSATHEMGAAPGRLPSDEYDVMVVGARVAGAATAMLLARCGYRVLVIDRAELGSDTVSTHAVLRLGVLQLQRWGMLHRLLEAGTPAIRTVTLGFGDEQIHLDISRKFGVDALYAPRRTVLDPILVEAAMEAGADVVTRTRLVDLLWAGDRVCGATVKGTDGERAVTARVVIGADGVWSRTADRARAAEYRSFPATNALHYAYYRGVDVSGMHFQFTRGVTAGFIPTNDDHVLVYVGRPAGRIDEFQSDPEEAFADLARTAHPSIGDVVRSGERVGTFRGTPGLPGFLRPPAGPGWALVGDAAYTKDPISAHGISDALRDAELCARAVDRSLRDPRGETEALSTYRVRRDRLSLALLEDSSELARYRWSEDEASGLMRNLSEHVTAECEAIVSLPAWEAVDDGLVRAG